MLDANQLEALAAVLEHGSFGAAARSLNLTLAAVSLRIRVWKRGLASACWCAARRYARRLPGEYCRVTSNSCG